MVAGIHGPVSIAAGLPNNINNLSIAELNACGVARVSLPVIVIFAAIRAFHRMVVALEDCGDFSVILQEKMLCSPDEIAVLKR